MDRDVILKNADKIHTTELGKERIKKNIGLDTDDVVGWCIDLIKSEDCRVTRYGKNFYVHAGGYIITISIRSHTIITVHDQNKNAPSYGDEAFNMAKTVEVLFSESAAGAMKIARSKNTDKFGHEILCLGSHLDIGDIREYPESEYRKKLIVDLYNQQQFGKDLDTEASLRNTSELYAASYAKLRSMLDNDMSLRIWYSERPYSLCGFYQLCSMLGQRDNRIYTVKLPPDVIDGNKVLSYESWGEIEPEAFTKFLSLQKKLPPAERNTHAVQWDGLVRDNSQLRVVVNGILTGVGEDFYDQFIWKLLTDKPVKEAKLLGDVLGKYQLGIGDYWYAGRIEHYIKSGKIKVVEDSDRKYERVISLA